MKEPGQEETPSTEANEEEAKFGETGVTDMASEDFTETEEKPQEEGPPAGEPPEEGPKAEAVEPAEPQPETRSRRFFRRSIRWVAGLLIVFFLGVLAAAYVFYRPANQRLNQTRTDLSEANQRIAQLESQVSDLEAQLEAQTGEMRTLEEENQALQEELGSARSHINILSSLSDINAARVALEGDDLASARAFLSNTPDTLAELEGLVSAEQVDKINAMQDRLDLALDILESSTDQAQSDLEVLARDLVDLENILFANP